MKIVTGHQPVYLPWLGLLHKASLADTFIFMDDVQFLRQDWNNRNRIKGPNGAFFLTVPVKLKQSASERLRDIRVETEGFGTKHHWQSEHWRALQNGYRRAPFWQDHAPFLESFYLEHAWQWLWELNLAQLRYLFDQFQLHPELLIASEVGFEGSKSDLVLDHCRKTDAQLCVTGTHGREYIDRESFFEAGVSLNFQEYRHPVYPQRFNNFVSHLTAFDLLLNHGPASVDLMCDGNVTRASLIEEAESRGTPGLLEGKIR